MHQWICEGRLKLESSLARSKHAPTEQVSWRTVAECSIADDTDAGIEESGCGNAIHSGALHLLALTR